MLFEAIRTRGSCPEDEAVGDEGVVFSELALPVSIIGGQGSAVAEGDPLGEAVEGLTLVMAAWMRRR